MPAADSFLPHSWCKFTVLGMPSNRDELHQWMASGSFLLHGDTLSFNDDRKWWGAEYRPGDVVIFHRLTVHRALPNRTPNIRVSADFRYQRADAPRDFRSRNRQASIDDFATAVRLELSRMGVSDIDADRVLGLSLLDGPCDDYGTTERLERLVAQVREGRREGVVDRGH